MNDEQIRLATRRIKSLATLRDPPYELPADSFLELAARDIYDAAMHGTREALEVARLFGGTDGGTDGGHHKAWVIDQMCRKLLGPEYDAFVAFAKTGEDGPETYEWDIGIPP